MVYPPPDWVGVNASRNTRMPMPPSQWLKLRHSRRPRLMASTFVRMDAPVVVKPDTISNTASTYEGICPLNTKGKQPSMERTIQASEVATKPSCA